MPRIHLPFCVHAMRLSARFGVAASMACTMFAASALAQSPYTLRAADATMLADLDVSWSHPARTTERRASVTDVILRLAAPEGARIESVLRQPDAPAAPRSRALFTVEVIVVAGGRAVIEERAVCAPWSSGASICRTECDGGAFAIIRHRNGAEPSLALRIGHVSADEAKGVRLGACRTGDDAAETSLVPKAGRSSSEIVLRRE